MRSERPPLTMLTFAPMIDSECTRRVLGAHGASYEERDRLFGWVSLLTLLHGGYGRVPLVYGKNAAMSGPAPTARFLDAIAAPERRLLPREQPPRQQVEAEFAIYNGELASDVAAFAYYHLLPQREAMIERFGAAVTPLGRKILPSVYGILRWLFSALLRLRPQRIDDVALRIETLLDWSDVRLSDNRPYLVGNRPTLADLGFMSAMAPIVVPPTYERNVPAVADLPPPYREMVMRTRNRPSGRFALDLYAKLGNEPAHRGSSPVQRAKRRSPSRKA
ncbi:MAG: hypothetical protein HOP91_09430 [Sphingomonas sp.]|nr:hypothetical protein [Sphingomonas sp.]